MKEEEILGILPLHIRTIIKQADINWDELQEIRLRIQKPVILKYNAKTCYLSEQGKITTRKEQLHIVTSQEIRQAMEYISSYSMYAYIEQLKQGFLTIRGGHRVGICGTIVMDHDKVKTIRHISGLNIRVAHEVKGCADTLYSRCTRMGKLIPTLIISPPGCGKTTLLRDMIRKISDEGQTVGVVDERSEIPQNYLWMLAFVGALFLTSWGLPLRFQPYANQAIMCCVMVLTGTGIMMIARIDQDLNTSVAFKQLLWLSIALVLANLLVIFMKDYRVLRRFSYVSMVIGLVLLLSPMLPVIGSEQYGARIWVKIPGLDVPVSFHCP